MTRSQPSAHRPSRRRPWAPLRARIGWPRPWRRTPSTADTAANAAPTAAARPPTGTGTARAAPTPSARPDSQPQRGQQPHRDPKPRQGPGLRALLGYFLGLGTWGFGGPIATVGYMQRDLVERRGWLDRQDFLNGVALGQTMPGPLAAQVVMWVGFLRRGWSGALATAAVFIAPSFAGVLAIAIVYVRYSGLPVVQSLFYGIAPAVMAIIAVAAGKLGRMTNRKDARLWAISLVVGLVTAITGAEVAVLFIAAGLLMILLDAPPRRPAGRARLGCT